ncbi:hypothetical protein GCM10017044_09520 [Kordiimonas sediminis]|uniref:Prepilin type IV endopeptidase peptidase domain-containing protein n=2 Tax=Kordiimonas sediminis TaxID=1735581 RepID=A0A919E3X7_9PROT|nr:hypothetical protein GCM10017044_09520 [Kordiimonas sediminis]
METRRLPNPLTGLLFIAGMLQAYMYGYFEAALYGALIGGVGLWLVAYVYQLVRKRRGMGMGDVKLLGAMGAWTGPFAIPYILLIASVTGIVFAYLYSLRDAEKRGALQAYPFGPFLALGGWIAFLILAA